MPTYQTHQTKYSGSAGGCYETAGRLANVEAANAQDALYAAAQLPETAFDFKRPIGRAVQRVYNDGRFGQITFNR